MADTSQVNLDGGYVPVKAAQPKRQLAQGWYPTHIVDVNILDRPVKGKHRAKIYNLTLEVAPEASASKFTIKDIKGEDVPITGEDYVGKTLRSMGVFYFLTPQIGEDYQANPEGQVGYKRFCDAMGVDMPKATIAVNGEKHEVYKLKELHKDDLLGLPVMSFLGESRPWKGKDGKTRTNLEVRAYKKWEGGIRKEVLEDIPF